MINHSTTELADGIDLVVVNYRTPDDLRLFLKSVLDGLPFDGVLSTVTVVQVAPTEDDILMAEDMITRLNQAQPGLAWQASFSWNIGYASACNAGAALGSSGVVALFNADTILAEDTLQRCYDFLAGHPSVGICGPRQVDEAGRITHAGIFGTNEQPRLRGWKQQGNDFQDERLDAVSVSGSAYFVKRIVWEQLTSCPVYQQFLEDRRFDDSMAHEREGAFLPTQHYYEETWASYHARAHGWKIGYVGSATMIHKWHKASPVGGHADRAMPESRLLFRDACDHHGIGHD